MGDGSVIPVQWVQPFFRLTNWLCQPAVAYTLALGLFIVTLKYRKQLARPRVAVIILILSLGFVGISFFNPQFVKEAIKPDNVPLWLAAFLVALCLWAALHQAVRNDERLRQGLKPDEADAAEKTLPVWPHLLYLEAIVATFAIAALLLWAMGLNAPLEQPADPANSPNPMKAPWYFVGLQELLVYFDPWIAGVILPLLTVTGLMCLPYCDRSPEGVGHFSFERRRFAISVYLFGFLMIWVMPIIVGTFLRGPNWSAFGLYETWDAHKFGVMRNLSLSQALWQDALRIPDSASPHWLLRESPGLVLLAAYFIGLPILGARIWKTTRERLGAVRYWIVAFHVLVMIGVPVRMYLYWVCGLKYILYLPEHVLNM